MSKSESTFSHKLLDILFDGVVLFDQDGKITNWTVPAMDITGYHPREMLGLGFPNPVLGLLNHKGQPLEGRLNPLPKLLKEGGVWESDLVFLRHKDGHRMPVHLRLKAPAASGNPGGIGVFRESSSKMEIDKKLKEWEQKSVLDPLTRLPNRNFMSQFLAGKIQEFLTARQVFGVLFIDVDNLTGINSRFGQEAGDRLLRAIGQTLAVNLRPGDMVSRWGGEEFFAVLEVNDADYCRAAAQKFVTLVGRTAIQAGNQLAGATISVGATLIGPGDDLSSLVVRADKLMQLSKKAGKNRVNFL